MAAAIELIRRRPSVHLVCAGVFLQSAIELDRVSFVPLTPLGFKTAADRITAYAVECGASVDVEAHAKLVEQGASADPCVSIIVNIADWIGPAEAEASVEACLEKYRELLSWATGDDVTPIGYITLGPADSYFRVTPPSSRRRQRLGFGNDGQDFLNSLLSILRIAEEDEHVAFALSMLHDANKEKNVRFKIARLFTCLEALAYRLKKGQGSRDAVRQLVGLEKGRTGQVVFDGRSYDYDVVLASGKLRDMLFHGTPIDFSEAKDHEKDTFDLLETKPEIIANDLTNRVELEIARWSNGASFGQINNENA